RPRLARTTHAYHPPTFKGRGAHSGTYALDQVLDNDGLSAVDRNLECLADLSHPYAAQCTDPLDQHCG
ncbi:MAG: precorrin-6x reductase, partial [Ilumatobacter sp.]